MAEKNLGDPPTPLIHLYLGGKSERSACAALGVAAET
jgi:hypothetical protein